MEYTRIDILRQLEEMHADLIAAAAALTCAFSLIQEKPSFYRIFMLANGVIWMVYDVNVGAYAMIVSHLATALSAGVGIVRLDLKNKFLHE